MADVPKRFDLNDPKIKYSNIAPEKFDLSDSSLQVMALPENVSGIESALRGGAQGLTFGFADELAGGLKSVFTDQSYEQARDQERALYDKAFEANPGTFIAGNVGGAIIPTLITGGTSAPATALQTAGLIGRVGASTIPRLMAQGALQGGIQGLGESEGKSAGDIAKDVAAGVIVGGATGGALGGLSRGGSKLVDALPSGQAVKEGLENRIIGSTTGLTDEGVDILRKNPDALNKIDRLGSASAADAQQAAMLELGNKLDNLPFVKKIDELADRAYATLDNSDKSFNAERIGQSIDEYIEKNLMVNGTFQSKTEEATARELLSRKDNLMSLAGETGIISAKDLKRTINSLRKDISFEKAAENYEVQGGLKWLQNTIDQDLKNTIPEFRSKMKPLAKAMEMKDAIEKRLYKQGEVDLNKVKTLVQGQLSPIPNLNDQQFINTVNKRFGEIGGTENLKDFLETVRMKKMMEAPSGKGSNLVLTGAAVGSGLGSMVGGALGGFGGAGVGMSAGAGIGATIGKRLETTARKKASSYFQNQADKAPDIIRKVNGTKYANVLQSAVQKGSRNFAVANYLLQQQDPQYRSLIESE